MRFFLHRGDTRVPEPLKKGRMNYPAYRALLDGGTTLMRLRPGPPESSWRYRSGHLNYSYAHNSLKALVVVL